MFINAMITYCENVKFVFDYVLVKFLPLISWLNWDVNQMHIVELMCNCFTLILLEGYSLEIKLLFDDCSWFDCDIFTHFHRCYSVYEWVRIWRTVLPARTI